MKKNRTIICLLLLPLFVSAESASVRTFNLSFESAPVNQVAGYYAELSERLIIPNPAIASLITINGRDLNKDEVQQAIETVLEMNNVTLVPVGDKFLKVVTSNTARKEGSPLQIHSADSPLAETDRVITRIITLKHADITEAQSILQQLAGRNGSMQPLERSGSLMITDSSLNIKRMLEVLEYVDQPAVKIEPRIYHLDHATAGDIASKLTELVEIAQSQTATSSSTQTRQTAPGIIRANSSSKSTQNSRASATTAVATTSAGSSMIEGFVKITSDERTNILIIFTKESNFPFFDTLITELDVSVDSDVLTEVIPLEYADSEDIATLISGLISGTSKQTTSDTSKTKDSSKKTNKKDQTTEPNVSTNSQVQLGTLSSTVNVLSDERTNSILIMGSKDDIAAIKSIIDQLDVMLAQVMIEAVILEVELGDTASSGVSWIQENSDSSGNIFNSSWNAANNLIDSATASTNLLSSSTLSHYTFIDGLNLGALIELSQTTSDVTILQTPVVMTTDNTEAVITVGEERPVVTSTGTSSSGNDYSSYSYKSIGIELTVTPHINPQRVVIMEIAQSADEVGDDVVIDDNDVPTILNREITATIAVRDRSTIALGGLIKTEERETVSKVPFLGDIPFIGSLFSSTSSEDYRSELLVLLTPYVLTTPEEAEATSRRVHEAATQATWPTGWSESPLRNEAEEK
jgi:general secretion pathway protein D